MKALINEKNLTIRKRIAIVLTIVLIIHIVVLAVFYLYANAQEMPRQTQGQSSPFSLEISPPTAYLRIQPGMSAMHTITVLNTSSSSITLSPEIVNFKPDGVSGNPQLLDKLDFPYLDSSRTNLDSIALQPGQERRVPLYITIPGDAPEQEHRLTVLFRKQPGTDLGSGVGGIVGSNVIVLVSTADELPANFEISDWQSRPIVDSFASLKVQPIIKNSSIAAQVASGSAQIIGPFGGTVAEYTMYSDVILGGSSRQLRWHSGKPGGEEDVVDFIGYRQAIVLGPYTVRLTINTLVGESVQNQNFEYTIFALPLSLTIAALFSTVLIWLYRRSPWKK